MASRKQPLSGKRAASEALELLRGETLPNRLLQAHSINVFLSKVLNQLTLPAQVAEPSDVLA